MIIILYYPCTNLDLLIFFLVFFTFSLFSLHFKKKTRSSWFNCALRDDEAVYWVSIGQFEAVAVGDWWYWVSRGHACLYILHKVEIWTGVTDAWQTTLKDSATQLLINYKIGALVTQFDVTENDKRKQPAAQPRPRQSERFHLAAARRRSWLLACCQDHHYQSLVTSSRVHTFTFSFFDRIPMI